MDCQLNWYEALIDCERRGLRLATVESEKEQEEVIKSIKRQGNLIYISDVIIKLKTYRAYLYINQTIGLSVLMLHNSLKNTTKLMQKRHHIIFSV